MSAMVSQIAGVSIICSTVCWGADQRKHQSSASLAFVRGIRRSPVDSPHKGTVTRKMFPFVDVIMWHWYFLYLCDQAKRNGANGIEFDVGYTSDGVAVLMHDDYVDRTTDGSGLLSEMPWEKVKHLNASAKDANKWVHHIACKSHDMETLSLLLALCEANPSVSVTGGFSYKRPVIRSLFVVSLDKPLNKRTTCRWFEA